MNFLDKLKFGRAFFGIVENPQSTENIFKLASIGLKHPTSPAIQSLVEHCFQNLEFKDQFEKKYLPENRTLESFRTYPEGSLGREYYLHMQKNNLSPDFFPEENINFPAGYIVMRLRYAHDIWHVITGYGTSVEDEIALQAFNLAQSKAGIPAILLGAGFLRAMRVRPHDIFDYFELIYGAFQRGKRAKSFLAIKYEGLWNQPLAQIRNDLNCN